MNAVLTDKLAAIDSYLERGWHLIPLHGVTEDGICLCYKGEFCKSPGKHPVENNWTGCGTHIKSKTHAQRVWSLNPDYNVGIVTGQCSGVFVLDVDVKDGKKGLQSLDKLIWDTQQDVRRSLIHTTGSGGFHIFLAMPLEGDITNATKGFADLYPDIDLRGTGGMVVAPPSVSDAGSYDVYMDNDIEAPKPRFLETVQAADKAKVVEITHTPDQEFDNLPSNVQQMTNAYARKGVEKELQRFKDEYNESNWDIKANEIAFNCFLMSNSPWNDLENGFIAKDSYGNYEISQSGMAAELFEHGFRGGDSKWDDERLAKCILSAYESVVGEGRTRNMPPQAKEALDQANKPSGGFSNSSVDWEAAFSFDPSTIKWLPGGFAREGDYLTMIGDGKVGKSVFCHDWAWRLATGQEFLGESAGEAIPVLYLDRENPLQIFVDHFRSYGATPTTMGLLDFRTFPEMAGLDTPEGGKQFVELVIESGAKVVFIDTISRFITGPENDNDTWLNVYRNTIVPLRGHDTTITVVRIDHFGKDKAKGGRGGSSKEQDVDSVYEMKKTQGGGFVLERTHTRSGLGPETVEFNRTGRALNDRWAEGETSHVLKPKWTVRNTYAVDKTTPEAMETFLDEHCVPDGENGWGVRKAREFLRKNDFKGRNEDMDAVQARRKARADYDLVCPHDCDQR